MSLKHSGCHIDTSHSQQSLVSERLVRHEVNAVMQIQYRLMWQCLFYSIIAVASVRDAITNTCVRAHVRAPPLTKTGSTWLWSWGGRRVLRGKSPRAQSLLLASVFGFGPHPDVEMWGARGPLQMCTVPYMCSQFKRAHGIMTRSWSWIHRQGCRSKPRYFTATHELRCI